MKFRHNSKQFIPLLVLCMVGVCWCFSVYGAFHIIFGDFFHKGGGATHKSAKISAKGGGGGRGTPPQKNLPKITYFWPKRNIASPLMVHFNPISPDQPRPRANTYTRKKSMDGNSDNFGTFLNVC